MSYLRQFSELDDNSAEFKRNLPPVFWEDGGLHEAAVRGGDLRAKSLLRDRMSTGGRLWFRRMVACMRQR